MCVCGYVANDGKDGQSSQALKYLQCVCMCVYVCMCAYVSMVAEMDRAVRPSSTSCVYVCECVCV